MTSPSIPWQVNQLQNSTQVTRNSTSNNPLIQPNVNRSAPLLPPLPRNSPVVSSGVNSYMPYSSGLNSYMYGGGMGGYGGLGGYDSFSSYGMPYRGSMLNSYNSYGGYNNYGMYGMTSAYPDAAEQRFIQYAEESSRNTFASVEHIVRAFNSISVMLDNTFFAMTSSFRAVLSVAENFGKLRTMFGQIWYSINIFRLFNWLYKKFLWLMGIKVPKSATSVAWKEAAKETLPGAASAAAAGSQPGSSWPTLAFLGVLVSAPYIISKFLPKYEDKTNPTNWKSPGVRAKAAFDFVARHPTELSVTTNDEIILAPTYVQEEMNLKNSGWAFAITNNRSGVVPLNYLVTIKSGGDPHSIMSNGTSKIVDVPTTSQKPQTKRVSFGENQIFENVDLEDYVLGKKEVKGFTSEQLSKEIENEKRKHDEIDSSRLLKQQENESNKENVDVNVVKDENSINKNEMANENEPQPSSSSTQ